MDEKSKPSVNQVQPQYVHLSRAVAPVAPPISEEIRRKSEDSRHRYPNLNLSDGEYVISAIHRHMIGLVAPLTLAIFLVALILSVLINYPLMIEYFNLSNPPDESSVWTLGLAAILLIAAATYVSVWVYRNNRFFLTNESVIQEIQTSLFHRHEQTVSLANIEDASFRQQGILQTLLNYGSIRLSTEGDETTYRFNYVADPKRQIAILNNAVEAFKNGRPFDDN